MTFSPVILPRAWCYFQCSKKHSTNNIYLWCEDLSTCVCLSVEVRRQSWTSSLLWHLLGFIGGRVFIEIWSSRLSGVETGILCKIIGIISTLPCTHSGLWSHPPLLSPHPIVPWLLFFLIFALLFSCFSPHHSLYKRKHVILIVLDPAYFTWCEDPGPINFSVKTPFCSSYWLDDTLLYLHITLPLSIDCWWAHKLIPFCVCCEPCPGSRNVQAPLLCANLGSSGHVIPMKI